MVAIQRLTLFALFVLYFFFPARSLCEPSPFEKGAILYKDGRYDNAITQFRKAYQLGLSKPDSIYYIAMCQQQLGDLEGARDSYKMLVTRYPNSALFERSIKMLKDIEVRLEGAAAGTRTNLNNPQKGPPREAFPAYALRPKTGIDSFSVNFTPESDGRIYLDGTVNGTKTKILFDTGAGVTFCRQSFIDRQSVKLNWISESAIIPGAMGEAAAKVAIVKIVIGNLAREDKIYVEQDRPESFYPALDNVPIVGQSFFGDMSYQIDGRSGVITFRKVAIPKNRPANAGKLGPGEVPFVRDGSHIIVKAKVNDRECDMILDTGASQVVFADRHLPQCGLNRPVDATNSIRKGAGTVRDSYQFKIDKISLGPIERQDVNVTVLVNTKFSKPLLGQAFLQGLIYTVDPVRNVIRFDSFN